MIKKTLSRMHRWRDLPPMRIAQADTGPSRSDRSDTPAETRGHSRRNKAFAERPQQYGGIDGGAPMLRQRTDPVDEIATSMRDCAILLRTLLHRGAIPPAIRSEVSAAVDRADELHAIWISNHSEAAM
jgi:hypothetical protein